MDCQQNRDESVTILSWKPREVSSVEETLKIMEAAIIFLPGSRDAIKDQQMH